MTAAPSFPGADARWPTPHSAFTSRIAYAAVPVIAAVDSENTPGSTPALDWSSTLEYRHRIWSYGLGVADAMDTAQRGMGLDWVTTAELITRSGREAAAVSGRIVCGAGTDQLDISTIGIGPAALRRVVEAYLEQVEVVSAAGANVVLMASRALVAAARAADDYLEVYARVLDQLDQPAILHWLGEDFDPSLSGYWGSTDTAMAAETVLDLIESHAAKVDGIKISLLDSTQEKQLRRRLPPAVRMYTGDDFNYPELIVGDEFGYSDALLGIFAAVFPVASAALQALESHDTARARQLLDSTLPLSRHVFCSPTQYYKTGIAFLSWLNGYQPGFVMVNGLSVYRSIRHLVRVYDLAAQCGLLLDTELAHARLNAFLQVHGAEASDVRGSA